MTASGARQAPHISNRPGARRFALARISRQEARRRLGATRGGGCRSKVVEAAHKASLIVGENAQTGMAIRRGKSAKKQVVIDQALDPLIELARADLGFKGKLTSGRFAADPLVGTS